MNTASASPISTGCLHFAIRMENARKAWTEAIRFLGKLTEAEADIVFAYYLKKKLIRYQAGSYNVKHGAYMDKPVLKRAAKLVA
jgi:mannitol/fructose-specific phosphotransferase system IIA component (Ntr-type)